MLLLLMLPSASLHFFCSRYWHFAALSPYSTPSIPLFSSDSSILRSSFPLQALTAALLTALTSAQKTTALLSSWRPGPAVPVRVRASTAGIAAAATAVAVAALAALHRPKRKSSPSQVVLHPAPPQQSRVSPKDGQQRAAAAQRLLLGRKTNKQRIQECDAPPNHAVVTGHIANCCVFYLIHPLHCRFSVMKMYSFWCHPFQEQPSGLSRRLTLPWVVLLSCAHCIFFYLETSHSVLCFFYLCPFSGVDSTGSWHLALGKTQGFMVM